MRLTTYDELRPLIESEGLKADLLAEAFKLISPQSHFLWLDVNEIEQGATEYAIKQGWDPETTLVLYSPPRSPADETDQEPIGDDSDFDIQIGSLNPNQAVCSLYQNLTVEKLADTINKIVRMKIFL